MNRLLLILLVSLGFVPEIFAGKNAIYRGSITLADIATGKTVTSALYFILGEETPVEDGADYTFVTGRFIYLNGELGRKRYAVAPIEPRFRSVEFTKNVRNKTTITEVITQAQGNATHAEERFFSVGAILLVGTRGSPKYSFPMTLKGQLLSSSASYSISGELLAGAKRGTFQMKLVTTLTDPVPVDETVENSTKRVTDYLQSVGYIEYAY